jgi:hypothetical protein
MRRGADVKVTINGVAYAVQRVRVGDRSPALNVSNSEGMPGNPTYDVVGGFVTKTPDLREGTLELVSATFDEDNNPFASPLSLTSGNWYAVDVFPAGLSGPTAQFGNLLLEDVSHDFNIPGLQPVTLRFQSDGRYVMAGET